MATAPTAHVMISTPSYTGDVCCDYAMSLAVASAHCVLRGIWIEPRMAPGFSLVEYARNWLVAEFLANPKFTHLFWVDSDLFFPPDAVAKLVLRKKDVICGVYVTKHDTKPIFPYTALGPAVDGLQLAERVPGGFLCMSRAAVEKVVESCEWHEIDHNGEKRQSPRFFDLLMKDGKLHGEDFIACARLRAAGFDIYVETDLTFKHYGRKAWIGNLATTLADEAAEGYIGQGNKKHFEKNARAEMPTE